MSILDEPNQEKLSDVYPEGKPFILYSVEYVGSIPTTYGPRATANVVAGPRDRSSEPLEFKVFGALAEATKNLQPNELPCAVVIERSGNAKRWRKFDTGSDVPF